MIGIGVGGRGKLAFGAALTVDHAHVEPPAAKGGVGSAALRDFAFVRAQGDRSVQPNQPSEISASAPTSSGVTLTGAAYSDPDNDPHGSSQWQITLAADTGFASPVYDSGEDFVNLVQLVVSGVLEPSTDYIARVRYREDLS